MKDQVKIQFAMLIQVLQHTDHKKFETCPLCLVLDAAHYYENPGFVEGKE